MLSYVAPAIVFNCFDDILFNKDAQQKHTSNKDFKFTVNVDLIFERSIKFKYFLLSLKDIGEVIDGSVVKTFNKERESRILCIN